VQDKSECGIEGAGIMGLKYITVDFEKCKDERTLVRKFSKEAWQKKSEILKLKTPDSIYHF